MSLAAVQAIEDAIRLCLEAKERLAPHELSQPRLLLDMLLLDLSRELTKAAGKAGH